MNQPSIDMTLEPVMKIKKTTPSEYSLPVTTLNEESLISAYSGSITGMVGFFLDEQEREDMIMTSAPVTAPNSYVFRSEQKITQPDPVTYSVSKGNPIVGNYLL